MARRIKKDDDRKIDASRMMPELDRLAADSASIMRPLVCSEPTYWDAFQD